MWDRNGLHAMNDEEKMDEDKEENSRCEVEYQNSTHIPFNMWCNHCKRGRGRRSGHKRIPHEKERVEDRSVTTYSIAHMYLTEEDNAEERDGGAGTARGSTTLGRPIIVGVDGKTG